MHLGQTKEKDLFHWQHLVAWLGGILCGLVPFAGGWEIGASQIPLRHGPGNFGFNLLIGIGLASVGALLAGYWWRLGKWLLGRDDRVMSVAVVVLLGLGLLGIFTGALDALFLYLVGGVFVVGLILAVAFRRVRKRDWPHFYDFLEWLDKKNRVNVVFFAVLLLALLINNLGLVWGMDAGFWEKVSITLGRFFTNAVLVCSWYLLAELVMRSAPKYFRWVPWLVLSLVPLLVILDQLLGMMWNRSLLDVVNSLTSSGRLDLVVELKTSGLDVGLLGAWLIVIGIVVLALLMAAGCWLVSKRHNMRLSIGLSVVLMIACWLAVVTEQGMGAQWKKITVWQDEHKAFDLQIGLFAPPKGLGTYRVSFHDGLAQNQGQVPRLARKPDIYLFMIESLRGDAIKSEVAPFLSYFRDHECQPFEGSWAASNATHLSWFAFFHSRVPVFWRQALEGVSEREKFAGAIPLQQLKQAGYGIEVRAVCDLGYKDFGFSNFGHQKNLLDILEQAAAGDELAGFNVAQRERLTMENLMASIISKPEGGGLYFTALDSPHYNYYWHKDFDPPFKEYDESTRFPLNPDEDDVQRVINRYFNSVAWVDSQLRSFCDFLKSIERYDESIIIITGDHGEEFQEQGSWFHCSSLRSEQIGVPILIKWPASMGRGPARKDVNHIDVIPTLMHALGMPGETISGMAGRNLWAAQKLQTSISTTAYAGKSGETMVLHRGGYEAVFYWEDYWESQVPTEIVLERLIGPDGKMVKFRNAGEYADELRLRFPDAFERFFQSLEVIKN